MDVVYEGKEIVVGFTPQTTFGTATAASGTFTEIFTDAVAMERDIKVADLATANGSKNPIFMDKHIHVNGSMPRFAIKGPYSHHYCDELMYAFTQAVTEGGTTPYTKTYTMFTTQPDFDTNEGKFLTFGKKIPGTSLGWRVKDCVATSFKLDIDRDGLLMMESEWVGNGDITHTNNFSGTWERGLDGPGGSDARTTQYGTHHFNQIDSCTLNVDGGGATGIILQHLTFSMSQQVEGIGPDGDGGWQNYQIHSREGAFELTFLKGSQYEAALASQDGDGYVQIVLNFGAATAAADGEMQLTINGKITDDPELDEDTALAGVLKGQVLAPTASGDMFELIMSNAIDRLYNE